METLSKEKILKQARIFENYQGNESDILGAEKGGKFHGFIAGAEWAIEKLEAKLQDEINEFSVLGYEPSKYQLGYNSAINDIMEFLKTTKKI